jgi:hypothetical protein
VSSDDETAASGTSAEALAALTDLMRRGRTSDAEAQIAALAEQDNGGDREAVLASLVAEPEVHNALVALEQWLDGTVDAPSAVSLGAWWALPAAGLDLPTVTSEARLYIDAYPKEGFVIGNVEERAADWLTRRIAMTFDPGPQLPAMRDAITMLAGAAKPTFPVTSASFDAVVTTVDDATLWNNLILQIVHSEMERKP